MKSRAIIISGGMLEKEFVLQEWKQHQESGDNCFLIGVDSGNRFLYEQQITPDYIVGDFDSLPEEILCGVQRWKWSRKYKTIHGDFKRL